MKSQAVILSILLLTCFFSACTTVKAGPALTPHEDPTAAKSTMDAYSFLEEYAAIFALMSNRQFENASQLGEQLSHISVPPDLRYVINRYNNLTQQLITVLNDLQTALDTTSRLLDQNRLSEVQEQLDRAGVLVTKAQILLKDLEDATSTLSQRLGVFAASAGSKVQQAYKQLQSMLEKLNALIELYQTLLQKANQKTEEIKAQNLHTTTLSFTLNSTKCFVGNYVAASGTLTSEGNPVGNRAVKLFIDGSQAATTNTDTNGKYYTTVKIPYKYVDSVLVNTSYTPEGNDKDSYLAALSPAIRVQVLFYKTVLEISAPDVAYPGLPLTVSGKVTAQDGTPLNHRQVNVLLDEAVKAQVETDQNGTFAAFTVDTQTQLGKHTLAVTVNPDGLYASITEQKTITIEKMATYLQVNSPAFIMLPAQLEITGKATSTSGPLKEATIQIEYSNISATAKTQDDGTFNLTINVPLNTALAGNQELTVKAQPPQPWQAATETKANIFALNSVSTSVALASSLSVFAVAYLRFSKTKKEGPIPSEILAILPKPQEKVVTDLPLAETKFEGIKGKILKAYVEALMAVQTVTNNQLTPNMTLREYTQLTQPKIGNATTAFTELTGLAEKSLYSPHAPQPEEQQKAEELTQTIRRILIPADT